MAFTSSPICPDCGDWNVQVVYENSDRGADSPLRSSGTCRTCLHRWSEESDDGL